MLSAWRIHLVLLSFVLGACGGSSSETPYPLEPAPHKATDQTEQKKKALPEEPTAEEGAPAVVEAPAAADY